MSEFVEKSGDGSGVWEHGVPVPEGECVFRRRKPPIPADGGHPFRLKKATPFGRGPVMARDVRIVCP
jgi:hypothetical protein